MPCWTALRQASPGFRDPEFVHAEPSAAGPSRSRGASLTRAGHYSCKLSHGTASSLGNKSRARTVPAEATFLLLPHSIPLDLPQHDDDTAYSIIRRVARAERLLASMQANPKADWKPVDVRALARAYDLTFRQRGTSQAVATNALGQHSTISMHKPIKPVYIKRLVQLIEAAQ